MNDRIKCHMSHSLQAATQTCTDRDAHTQRNRQIHTQVTRTHKRTHRDTHNDTQKHKDTHRHRHANTQTQYTHKVTHINAHKCTNTRTRAHARLISRPLQGEKMPEGVPVVLAHGANDRCNMPLRLFCSEYDEEGWARDPQKKNQQSQRWSGVGVYSALGPQGPIESPGPHARWRAKWEIRFPRGAPQGPVGPHGAPRGPTGPVRPHGAPWVQMGPHGTPWGHMGPKGPWAPLLETKDILCVWAQPKT